MTERLRQREKDRTGGKELSRERGEVVALTFTHIHVQHSAHMAQLNVARLVCVYLCLGVCMCLCVCVSILDLLTGL